MFRDAHMHHTASAWQSVVASRTAVSSLLAPDAILAEVIYIDVFCNI